MPQKPIPKTPSEIINNTIQPYAPLGDGNPNIEPNRGNDISVKNDTQKEINIRLIDVYESLVYYIKEVIKPVVIENNKQINVPVEFAYGDRWNEVQKNGFLRDKDSKVLLPMILIKRDQVQKRRDLGNKLDGNNVNLYQSFTTKYTRKNQYDNFAALTNRVPVEEYHIVPVPDYVTLTYNASILTNSVEHCDHIIEAFNFAEDSYWGNVNRYKFKVNIESFTDTVEYNQGEDRSVRSNFNIVVGAYLLPDSVNRAKASQNKVLSKAVLKIEESLGGLPAPKKFKRVKLTNCGDLVDENGDYFIDSDGLRINFFGGTCPENVLVPGYVVVMDDSYFINYYGQNIKVA
jgi:hypothetical protein